MTEQFTEVQLKEAREIFYGIQVMGPGLTLNDRIVYIARCLAKARQENKN